MSDNTLRVVIIIAVALVAAIGIARADCIDMTAALPGQTYVLDGSDISITFGESQVSGFCPAGEARMDWIECVEVNDREYCSEQSLPLTYQTRDGSDWILIPNLAVGWLMSGKLFLIPGNTPMLEMQSKTSAGPVPWGSW